MNIMYQTSTRPTRKNASRTVKKYLAASIGSMFVRPHNNYSQRSGFEAAPMMNKAAVRRKQNMSKGLISGAVSMMATSVICATIVISEPAYAGWWQDLYDEYTVGANVTSAQRVHAGNMTGYTGGSLVMRLNRRPMPPLIAFDPPRFNVGCGGIDIYLGSFSHIDKDEFIEALRNMGQQALAGLFMAAVKAMSPLIGGIIEYLMGIVNAVNSFNRDACGMGAKLGSDIAERITKGEALGDALIGEVKDFGDGLKQWGGKVVDALGKYDEINFRMPKSEIPTASLSKILDGKCVEGCNIIWFALAKKRYGNSGRPDEEFYRDLSYIMSLIGSYVIVPKGESLDFESNGFTLSPRVIAGIDVPEDFPQEHLVCDSNVNLCPFVKKKTISANSKLQYYWHFKHMYEEMVRGVRNRESVGFSPEQNLLLTMTSIPLWRLAALEGTPGVFQTVAASSKDDFLKVAAIEAAHNLITGLLHEIYPGLKDIQASSDRQSPDMDKAYKLVYANIDAQYQSINMETQKIISEHRNPHEMLKTITLVERAVYSGLNLAMVGNMKFSGAHN